MVWSTCVVTSTTSTALPTPWSFATGPGRYFASLPPGKYLVGAAWFLHAVADPFHHPSLCCSNAKKKNLRPAVLLGADWVYELRYPLRPADHVHGPRGANPIVRLAAWACQASATTVWYKIVASFVGGGDTQIGKPQIGKPATARRRRGHGLAAPERDGGWVM